MSNPEPIAPVRADSAAYKLGTTYPDVPYEEKERLFAEVKADGRYEDYLYGCYECGICVAACPSARYYDFSPRRIAQAAGREDVELLYQQMQEDIWECSQCFSCLRCPRGNNPGGVITIMREVAVNNGLESAKHALRGYTRIIYKIMSTGTQVSPDMLDIWRRALPPETHHTTTTGWEISTKTLVELYLIWHKTGALDMIAELDASLHSLLEEVMEDLLEEEGYELDD
jgi:heterodisulfide reductase subunit C